MTERVERDFREWMQSTGTMGTRPISDAVSRCKRVEKGFRTTLEAEYNADKCERILNELEYSFEDEKQKKKAPEGLQFSEGANLRNGLASLRAAVKKYAEFSETRTPARAEIQK